MPSEILDSGLLDSIIEPMPIALERRNGSHAQEQVLVIARIPSLVAHSSPRAIRHTGYYNATFTNANADIYIQYGDTGLGASLQYLSFLTYPTYSTAYGNIANKIQVGQSALLTYDHTAYCCGYVEVTAALGTALGFSGATGITTSQASGARRLSSYAASATPHTTLSPPFSL